MVFGLHAAGPRSIPLLLLAALALSGCVRLLGNNDGGGLDGAVVDTSAHDLIGDRSTDSVKPSPDLLRPDGPRPDKGIPPPDKGVKPLDKGVLPPDKGVPPPDKGVKPDKALPPDQGITLPIGLDVKRAEKAGATATCPQGYTAVSGGALCALNSYLVTSVPTSNKLGWTSTCTGAVTTSYVNCIKGPVVADLQRVKTTVTIAANTYATLPCPAGTWEISGGCACGAGELVATTGSNSMTPGADPRWRCMCSATGAITIVAHCIPGALFNSLKIDHVKNQGGTVSTITSSCKGGKRILGGGCQQTQSALGKVLYSKSTLMAWSCGYTTAASHLAERYCVTPAP